MLGLALSLFHLPAGSPPLRIFPMAPVCLSAGITLMHAFTHCPQKSALQPAAPSELAAKPLQSHPSHEEAEILARNPVAEGREASRVHLSVEVSCTLLILAFRDENRSLGYPAAAHR